MDKYGSDDNNQPYGFATKAIHAGQSPDPSFGSIMTPIYQTSTFVQESPGTHKGYEYARTGNPTRTALEENLAALEHGKHGICFSSGCAAADAILHLLKPGDHIISGDDIYGGTFRLFDTVFGKYGIDLSFVNLSERDSFLNAIREDTKMLWLESPTNPLLKITDIEALADQAKQRGLITVVDNTFASPYLQTPLPLGADIVLHSSTKYIGGHSDVVAGALVCNDQELSEKLYYLQNAIGAVPAPLDCFLLLRSTKTLALRMEKHCENALAIASFLDEREDLSKVIYPGLISHPDHKVAMKQMSLGGGIITIELKGGLTRAKAFLEKVKLFSLAESLGGVESLIEHPAIMTHASIPGARRQKLGISEGLVRISVGIEDLEDLKEDLAQSLNGSSY